MPASHAHGRDPPDRVLDIERRLRGTRLAMAAMILAATLASTRWLGPTILVIYFLGMLALALSDRFAYTLRRPGIVIFAGMFANVVACGVIAAVTGGVKSPALFLIIVPTAGLTIRYRGRVLLAGTLGANAIATAACVAPSPHAFFANPTPLLFLLATMNCISVFTVTTQRIEIYHRTQSVIDPLTGLYNRSSLRRRFDELSEQARNNDQSVSVLVCDLDHFKRVNDTHGHAAGDAVLKNVAYTMRKILRHGDLIYRIGGEEFVILLPGLSLRAAVEAAERLRVAIAGSDPAGVAMTMSFGAVSLGHEHRGWTDLYEIADACLYQAKQRGRNQVCPSLTSDLLTEFPDVSATDRHSASPGLAHTPNK